MNNISKQQGQSLLEMVFAIGILLVVVTVLLGLTVSAISGQQESETQIVANNLAREAIEVVRGIRDANWLAGEQWSTGLAPVTNAIVVFDPTSTEPSHWSLTTGNSQVWRDGAVFSHLQPEGSQRTIYDRTVDIAAVCEITTPPSRKGEQYIATAPLDCGVDAMIGIQVESRVSWPDRGRAREVIIRDILYGWR